MEAVLKQLDKEYLPNKKEDSLDDTEGNQFEESQIVRGEQSKEKKSNQDEKESHIESEASEMMELAAPIHPRNTSRRGLINNKCVSPDNQ